MPRKTPNKTLRLRLIVTSILWVVVTLFTAGFLLVYLFQSHIERSFDRLLSSNLDELVAASEIDVTGSVNLPWRPADPRFNRPHSGWYWHIILEGRVVAKSISFWGAALTIKEPKQSGRAQIQEITGPRNVRLRALVQKIRFPDDDRAFTFVVAGPASDIERDVWAFAGTVISTLSFLGISLFGVVIFQVSFGLKPLRAIRKALSDIRTGRSSKLTGAFPMEVQPVISELNDLLSYNAALLDRARTQVGNLAHSLKNPLTVIGNEARQVKGKRGALMRKQLQCVNENIDRYLSRARISGASVLGTRTDALEVLKDLKFSMNLLYKDRDLNIQVADFENLSFQGDAQDFEEMLGNIMDNACKWSRGAVSVKAELDNGRLLISVEDDGPGIPEEMRAEVLKRGLRMDEKMPGTGLGLGIARDIAELYRGSLELGRSSLGGLSVKLTLPAAQ